VVGATQEEVAASAAHQAGLQKRALRLLLAYSRCRQHTRCSGDHPTGASYPKGRSGVPQAV
jgi:hypothetical protein